MRQEAVIERKGRFFGTRKATRFGTFVGVLVASGVGYKVFINGPVVAQPMVQSSVAKVSADGKVLVTSTSDNGPGSLREAMKAAANRPGTTVVFNISERDENFRDGAFWISPNSPLPDVSANKTVIDGASQTAFGGDTNASGPEIAISGDLPTTREQGPQGTGFQITGADCVLRSLVINGFGMGVSITGQQASGNAVRGCYIGTNAGGKSVLVTQKARITTALSTDYMTSLGNTVGVQIGNGASGNAIGGTASSDRNVISGNLVYQISITDGGTDANVIQGNYIGLGSDGTTPLPFRSGISIEDGPVKTLIGGTVPGARNVIACYGEEAFGIRIRYSSHDNVMEGNYIGTDKDGKKLVGDGFFGILINKQSERNRIGGTVPGARNVVAAQRMSALAISYTDKNIVQGNYLGTDATGTNALGKGDNGMCIYAGSSNIVGGATTAERNIISGNFNRTVLLMTEAGVPATSNNLIQGNYIGTDPTGRAAVGTQKFAVAMRGVVGNTIGLGLDNSGAGNLIAYSKSDAVRVYALPNTPLALQNAIRGNLIRDHGGLAINLQPENEPDSTSTPNDAGDADGGPNNSQNAPTITDVSSNGENAGIATVIESTPNTRIILDFYRSSFGDDAKAGGGETYLGNKEVTTDGTGKASVVFEAETKPEDGYFTATATNAATGDTSEFSARASGAESPTKVATAAKTAPTAINVPALNIAPAPVKAPATIEVPADANAPKNTSVTTNPSAPANSIAPPTAPAPATATAPAPATPPAPSTAPAPMTPPANAEMPGVGYR